MPYTYKKQGGKYVVSKGGKKVGTTGGTKEELKKYLAALHIHEPKKSKKEEGIHDRNILSAPHTNIKTPPKGVGDYDPASRAANLKALKNFGPKGEKSKKEEGVLEQVYAVQKPYSGCELTALVHPIDPLLGIGAGHEIAPEDIHGVYQDQEQAQAAAQGLYEEYTEQRKNLEEKKGKVVDKIKKVMNKLEAERKHHTEMIKENPKDSSESKHKVAELTHKLDELINTLERVEISKQPLEEENPEETKEKLKEALSVVFEKKYHEFSYEPVQGKEKQKVLAKDLASAKKKAYEKGGDPKTVKAEEEPKEELK